ncbi:hypothetical protein [Methylobacterium oryzihabitans]|nr:hypothetical protein [Methylobacterium oryzihabitans]
MDLLQLYCLVALPVAALGLYGLARTVGRRAPLSDDAPRSPEARS